MNTYNNVFLIYNNTKIEIIALTMLIIQRDNHISRFTKLT